MNRAKSVLLLASLCLLLTSCFRIENSVKVHDDGRVSVDQILAVNVDEFSPEAVGLEGESIPRGAQGAFCEGVQQGASDSSNLQFGQEISNYKSGGYCGVEISLELDAAPDHSQALTAVFEQSTRLVRAAGGWEFETQIVPEQYAANTGFQMSEITEVLEQAEVLLIVELPGSAIDGENNATKVSGSKFTWEIDLMAPPARLHAKTGPVTGLDKLPVSPKVLGVIAANLLVIGGVGWFFLRDEKQPAVAADASVPTGQGAVMATPAAAAAAAAPGTPYYDESYGIWMLDDPARGLLWHREATDEWVAF